MSSQPTPSSSRMDFRQLLTSIREAKSKFRNGLPKIPSEPIHPPPPAIQRNLAPPEDITSRLADIGLEFKVARKVSQAYVDRAVQLQFLSQSRLVSNHKKVIRAARNSKALANITSLQAKLRNSQQKLYKRDLHSLLSHTMDAAKSCCPKPVAPEPECDDDDDSTSSAPKAPGDSLDGSDDEDNDVDSTGNAEDERALQDMSARASVLLSQMYELGFHFPRRHEKIKLAEATGLTYRQIGIWYSNRRERNRPGKRGAASTSLHEIMSVATRESTVEATPYENREETPTSPFQTEGGPSHPIVIDEDAAMEYSPNEREQVVEGEEDLFGGTDVEDDGSSDDRGDSRVPSLSTSVATLDSLFRTSSMGDAQPMDGACDDWSFLNSNNSSYVEVGPSISNNDPSIFDFNLSMDIAEQPHASAPTSVDFTDLSFLAPNPPPVAQNSTASADFLAGFAAAAAAFGAPGFAQPVMPPAPQAWAPMPVPMQPNYPPPSSTALAGLGYQHGFPDASYGEPSCSRPVKRVRLGDAPPPSRPASSTRNSLTPRPRTASSQRPKDRAAQSAGIPSRSTSAHGSLPHKVAHNAAKSDPRHIRPMSVNTINPSLTIRPIKPLPSSNNRKIAPAVSMQNSGLALPIPRSAVVQQ